MSNEFNEMETTMEPMETYEGTDEVTEYSEGNKGLTALLIAGGVALVGAAAVGVKKLVDKKKASDKPKKQKTKLKLVRVPVEEKVEEVVEPDESVDSFEEAEK